MGKKITIKEAIKNLHEYRKKVEERIKDRNEKEYNSLPIYSYNDIGEIKKKLLEWITKNTFSVDMWNDENLEYIEPKRLKDIIEELVKND